MKRFMLFSFAEFYPGGGLGDVRASFDTEEEARSAIKDNLSGKESSFYLSEYWYLWDRIEDKTIIESEA